MNLPEHWKPIKLRALFLVPVAALIGIFCWLTSDLLSPWVGATVAGIIAFHLLLMGELYRLNAEEGLRICKGLEKSRERLMRIQLWYSQALRHIYEQTDSELLQTYAKMMVFWERSEEPPAELLLKFNELQKQKTEE